MKALVTILAIGVVAGGLMVAFEAKGRTESKIEFTSPAEAKQDRKELRALVVRYYEGLRAGKYAEMATLYSPEAAEAMGGREEMARALKGATELLGVPSKVELHAIRIEDQETPRRARGELVVPDADPSGQYAMKDSSGKHLGKWSKTLHFVHLDGRWMLSEVSDNEADLNMSEAQDLLKLLAPAN